MPYFAVDDGFTDHPKVVDLLDCKHGKGALALWVLAGSWCQKHARNGVLPRSLVRRLGFADAEAAALCTVNLWHAHESGGYAFHDWDLHNGDGALVKRRTEGEKREQGRVRSQRFRDKERNAVRNAESVTRDAENNAPVTPIPSHPIPEEAEGEPPPRDAGPKSVTSVDASRAWRQAAEKPGGATGIMHAERKWRLDFEIIAGACNVEKRPEIALEALCSWFWLAPEGPVQSGRITRSKADPGYLAKYVTRDLEAAFAWWQASRRVTRDALRTEAAE